jgi:signal transduction histidine kinase
MAASETRATEPLPIESLRAKYAELATKYQQLVERVDHRAAHDLTIYKLGTWGLQATSAALAVVESGGIALSNARFTFLARTLAGPLVCIDPPAGNSYPDLRALATAEAAPLMQGRRSASELRYRDAGSTAVLSIRLERNRSAREPAVLLIAEDVTEHARRDSELERTREGLLHRERLRVLGELAVSIAHDLGNTLRGTSFQLAMLEDPALPPAKRAEALRGIGERIEIASSVISRLHDFAHTGSLKTAAIQLQRIVSQAVAIVETELREGEQVEVRVSIPALPQVRGSPSELSLLFVNLLRNARQAMPEGGIISIAARRRGDSVIVTLADQGTGIPAEVQARLFEPFLTTKGAQGTGLGLWLAAGTMARLGGSIRAVNRPQGGALFSLTFPVMEVSPRGPRRPATRTAAPCERPARAPRRRRRAPRSGRRT